jgi:hypothetical protein
MIQSLDVTWRVFATFLASVAAVCLALFVFFPLFLSLLKTLLRFVEKGIIIFTNMCMKMWGKLVISWRRKAAKYPQFLVKIEDCVVAVITAVLRLFEKIVRWKPGYGAISVRIVLVSSIFLILISLSLWILPGTSQVLTTFYTDWEREYIIEYEQPATLIVESLSPRRNKDVQVYYKLSQRDASLCDAPNGKVIASISEPGLLLRYLGQTEEQWIHVEIFEGSRKVEGWLHETMISPWEDNKDLLTLLKPGGNVRISARGIPIFTRRFLGIRQAEDGTITIILENK